MIVEDRRGSSSDRVVAVVSSTPLMPAPERRSLGNLADGTPVFDKKSGTRSHLKDHPEVEALLPECFRLIKLSDFTEANFAKPIDLGRVVGTSACIEVGPHDDIVYGTRPGRDKPSRFVLGRLEEPCTTVKLVLWHNKAENLVVVITAFIGGETPPEPWSTGAARSEADHQAAVKFWERHALVPKSNVFLENVTKDPAGFWEKGTLPAQK
jgi:hypothetical protein